MPLHFSWSVEPLGETLAELVETGQAPVYVVHFTQAAAVAQAESLLKQGYDKIHQRGSHHERLLERLAGVRFGSGFGKTLSKLLRRGIGVHHAGMLPRYRRLVEQLAQEGLLTVICGTDTLGVGINDRFMGGQIPAQHFRAMATNQPRDSLSIDQEPATFR